MDIAVGADEHPVLIDRDTLELVKLDALSGSTLWTVAPGGNGVPAAISAGPDGSVVAALTTDEGQVRVIKLAGATGAFLWDVTLAVNPAGGFVQDVAVGPDGQPVVVGAQSTDEGDYDVIALKLSGANGSVIWTSSIGGEFDDFAEAVAIGSDGRVVVAGLNDTTAEGRVIRLDGATGAVVFDVVLSDISLHGAALDSVGDILVSGDGGASKLDGSIGSPVWMQALADGSTLGRAAVNDSDDLVVIGSKVVTFDGGTGEVLSIRTDVFEATAIASAPNGDTVVSGDSGTARLGGRASDALWVSVVGGAFSQYFGGGRSADVAIGEDGNPVVVSTSTEPGFDVRTIKFDGALGTALWDVSFDSGTDDFATAIAIGPDGHPIVAGISSSDVIGPYRLIKLDAVSGAELWSATLDNGGMGQNAVVAVGADGDPVFAATVGSDILIAKFEGDNGSLLWTATFDSGGEDTVGGVAVGFGSTVFVAVTSDADIRVVRLNGSDGTMVWSVPFDAGDTDTAGGVAILPDGHPVISGISRPSGAPADVRTFKLDAPSGTVLWQSRFGPAGSGFTDVLLSDTTVDVSSSPDGNPVVTVGANGSNDNSLVRAIRYDGTTGSEISNTPLDLSGEELSTGVAVGPDGNPVGAVLVDGLFVIKFLAGAPTLPGVGVTVTLNGGPGVPQGVSVSYAAVSSAGVTTVFTGTSGPALPSGFTVSGEPLFYEIQTTASASAPITPCLGYDPAAFENLANLQLLHFESAWATVTTAHDTVAHTICGQVSSLSPFVVAEALVVQFPFTGFFSPVDNLPVLNEVNAGQAVPVKFSLGGFHGLDIFALGYPKSQLVPCDATVLVDGIEETVTAGSSGLSYDPGNDQYKYVWKTDKQWAKTCRQLVVKLSDGSFHRANFKFKK